MKGRLIAGTATSVAALLALAGGSVARADGATPRNVSAAGCILASGGHRTVPAGSTVVITAGWISGTAGAVRSFLQAQTTIVSVNDGPMADVSGLQPEPSPDGDSGNWSSRLSYPTNVTLASPGDTMRFTYALILARPVNDVFDFDGDGTPDPDLVGAGLAFGGTCTVTAV